jgi:hypothetical protein
VAANDLVTVEEVLPVLSVKVPKPWLAARISAVSKRLDDACGAVVQRTVTGELHDGGDYLIRLKHPAAAFASVTEYQATTSVVLTRETVGTQPADGYYADLHLDVPGLFSGLLIRRSGGADARFYPGRGNISVTYTAGRYADTETVPEHFKEAALIMLKKLADGDQTVVPVGEFDTPGARLPTFGVPRAVKELLFNEWREIPGVG